MVAPPGIVIGAMVAKGEVLADASAEGGPAVLAPTSGRVVGLGEAALTNGQTVPAVELESDFEDRRQQAAQDARQAGAAREVVDSDGCFLAELVPVASAPPSVPRVFVVSTQDARIP